MGILPCHPRLSSAAGIQFSRAGIAAGGFWRPWDFIAHEAGSPGEEGPKCFKKEICW